MDFLYQNPQKNIFDFEKIDSVSTGDGCVLKIKNIKQKNG